MDDGLVVEDLRAICEFEVMLRNVLAWRDLGRDVIQRHSDGNSGIDAAMLDQTLKEVQRLIEVVATVREMLGIEQAAQRPGQRAEASAPDPLPATR